jgi:hypothetical protein
MMLPLEGKNHEEKSADQEKADPAEPVDGETLL